MDSSTTCHRRRDGLYDYMSTPLTVRPGRRNRAAALVALLFALASTAYAVAPTLSPADETLLERAYALDAGKSAPRDAAAAADLYRQAAAQGDAFAHLRLGYLYETGDGVPQDYAAARSHYRAAVDAGLKEAHLRLAICYLEGWGGPADRAAFTNEVHAAAEAGYVPAQQILATMYFIGFGVPKSRADALQWLQRAAAKDDAGAQFRIGEDIETRHRLALMPDLALARNWYQLSAENEYNAAMRGMARTFLSGSPQDRNWAVGHRWLELATQQGDREAPYMLAVFEMLHVDAPTRDEAKARVWLQQASDRGNATATEVIELANRGRPLADAMRYVLRVPFADRYVQERSQNFQDTPTHPPQVYRIVQPVYPFSLRLTETKGNVIVDFYVDTTGRVIDAKPLKATHPLFGERALEAVQQWRFHPARQHGRLVKTHMQVPVTFDLRDDVHVGGVDDLLSNVAARAKVLGPDVEKDAVDLRVARPQRHLARPVMPDGAAVPADAKVVLLLVLDGNGHPVRGHIISAVPKSMGEPVLTSALQGQFEPLVIDGESVTSNTVLVYATGRRANRVLE